MKKEKQVLGVYMPVFLREWVETTASKEGRSLSNQVVQLLNEARAARESGGK